MVKMIAVDMDGTFLDNKDQYNVSKFEQFFELSQKKDVHFVVASGNQYYQLKSFFEGYDDKISYVSENGARVVFEGEEIFCAKMDQKDLMKTIEVVETFDCDMIVCGQKSAYILEDADEWWYNYVAKYNHRLQKINHYSDLLKIDDIYFKFALQFKASETMHESFELLQAQLPDAVEAVITADKSIDLIIKGFNKGSGLQMLVDVLNITAKQVIAYGDNGNDLEMIQIAGKGVVVDNGIEVLKAVADEVIADHNHDSVLDHMLSSISE